ncbi:MAG: PKD domain-containing protein [archaeon]|nr:PKD domain-containing protein [archaeon]MDA1131399.1 PKD domain-containing protein [archaeon]
MRGTAPLLILTALMILTSGLSGCINALDSTVDPRASLQAYPLQIQEGEMVTFDARDSSPVEGLITNYKWDFGDGSLAETVVGFTSHAYPEFGVYTVRLTVVNDQGGEDDSTATISVNGAPLVNLSIPEVIRAGDSVFLDASNSIDPEGGELDFVWDLNLNNDSDGDANNRNDIDANGATVLAPTDKSGNISFSLTITDMQGATITEIFTLEITTRRFEVTWMSQEIEYSWEEYLEQGGEWQGNITPGDGGRILSFEALLELDPDLVAPQDNFTLILAITEDGYRKSANTEGGNLTNNESTSAMIEGENINPLGNNGTIEADSRAQLLEILLSQSGARKGQGNWTLTVIAQQAEPDPVIEGFPDPDPGNDWKLTIRIIVLVPKVVEIAY